MSGISPNPVLGVAPSNGAPPMFRRKDTTSLPALSVVDGGAPPEAVPGEIKMTTREVADLTGKEHSHVMRDTRTMLNGLQISEEEGQSKFGSTYRDAQGKERSCYVLPKRELMILVTGYSVTMRAALVDRVEQLELERRHPNVVALPASMTGGHGNPHKFRACRLPTSP